MNQYEYRAQIQRGEGISNTIGSDSKWKNAADVPCDWDASKAPVIQILSIIFGWNHMPANARFTGFCIGMLGDLIFLTSVLCMKDSWRAGIPDKDRTELVTSGIYRYSRNPAFLGFDFMYIGMLLMYFNLPMLAVSAFAIIMLHLQILQEERYLTENYGESYREYRKHVFRYLGRR